jgi:hypothetical protein
MMLGRKEETNVKLSGVLFLLVSFFAVPPLQSQGLLFIQQETREGKSTTSRIQIEKNRMRAESSATGESTAFTFDGDRDIVRSINFDKKTYLELDQAQVKQIRQQLDQLEEKLKGMPAQRRAIVEKMMQGRGRGGALLGAELPPVEYRQAGSDKVAQWACSKYDGYRGKEKVMEVCTVDPKVFGLTPADFDVARQLADFMKNLIPQIADQASYMAA